MRGKGARSMKYNVKEIVDRNIQIYANHFFTGHGSGILKYHEATRYRV